MTEQDMNYQETPGVSQTQEILQNMEQDSTTVTNDEHAAQRERVMFERHVQENGEPIPANFKTAGDWFDSLKEAQGNYTRGQQEISALKTQYEEGGVTNPNYVPEQEAPQAEVAPEVELTGTEELRLEIPKEAPAPEPQSLNNELWQKWGGELASTGEMSEDTMAEIKAVTQFPDEVIKDYIDGQKAKMRESFGTASEVVGGRDKLKEIFTWAENNLSPEEQSQINQGLASPTYEITLRGLESMYNQRSVAVEKGMEPSQTPNLQQVSATETGFSGYKTKREFMSDRNNPRFKLEPQFREAVEQRMVRTDFNTLPA